MSPQDLLSRYFRTRESLRHLAPPSPSPIFVIAHLDLQQLNFTTRPPPTPTLAEAPQIAAAASFTSVFRLPSSCPPLDRARPVSLLPTSAALSRRQLLADVLFAPSCSPPPSAIPGAPALNRPDQDGQDVSSASSPILTTRGLLPLPPTAKCRGTCCSDSSTATSSIPTRSSRSRTSRESQAAAAPAAAAVPADVTLQPLRRSHWHPPCPVQ